MIKPTLDLWQPEIIYSDRNFPQTTNAQKRRGLRIKEADKGPNSVMEGIRVVQHELSTGDLVVDVDACPLLWREFGNYRWATDSKGDPVVPEKPVKKFDDALDALRYALYMATVRPKKRARFAGREELEGQMDYESQMIGGLPPQIVVGRG